MAEKPNFLSFRADDILAKWVRSYAKRHGLSGSDVMRQALLEYKMRQDAVEESDLGDGIEVLKSEAGCMFRVVSTENGVLLEKVRPGVVEL